MRAFVFPGQGSQKPGMGKALAEASAASRAVFEEVDEALGEKLSDVIWGDDAEALTLTQNAQPALMAVSVAVVRALEERDVSLADAGRFVAGHSLGEYSALTAAGALSVSDAARLLRLRGTAMQQAVPIGEGAMAAVLGLDLDQARAVAEQAASEGVCEAANDNAPGQVVLSGHKAAIEAAVDLAKEAGAKRAILLPVSAPFHCALMVPAADAMADALAQTEINKPSLPVVTNVAARAESDPAMLRSMLVEQVTGSVRWRESVLWMAGEGVDTLVELGAGKVLSGLAKRIDRGITATSAETPEEIDALAEALSQG